MLYQDATENFRQSSSKVCPECGEHLSEHEQSYIQECDRCLSKKEGL